MAAWRDKVNPTVTPHFGITVNDLAAVRSALVGLGTPYSESESPTVAGANALYVYDPTMNLIEVLAAPGENRR